MPNAFRCIYSPTVSLLRTPSLLHGNPLYELMLALRQDNILHEPTAVQIAIGACRGFYAGPPIFSRAFESSLSQLPNKLMTKERPVAAAKTANTPLIPAMYPNTMAAISSGGKRVRISVAPADTTAARLTPGASTLTTERSRLAKTAWEDDRIMAPPTV